MRAAPSPLDVFKPIAGRALELVLDQLLALDPETRAGLAALDGRRVELQLSAPALALAITVRGDRLEVGPADPTTEPDLGLRATLGGLLAQLPFLRPEGGAPVGKLRINGDAELAPGVSVHLIGGHTMGLQVVRVATRRGWVVLASDASHFYANMEESRPFPIVFSVADMVEGYGRLRALAESPAHIIPGHDPLVLERYPAPSKALEGVVVRLD